MPFLSDQTIRVMGPSVIHPFRAERVGTGAYELSLHRDSRASGDGHCRDERFLEIPPGQFAYLFTEERVSLGNDHLGFISIKSSLKWQGLINISGFHVDPGYNGQLKFAVYNAGPRTVCLKFNAPAFQLWLASFDQSATPYQKQGCSGITDDDLSELSESVASPSSLDRRLREIEGWFRMLAHALTTIGIIAGVAGAIAAIICAIPIVNGWHHHEAKNPASISATTSGVPLNSVGKSASANRQTPPLVSATTGKPISSALPLTSPIESASSAAIAQPQASTSPTPAASKTP